MGLEKLIYFYPMNLKLLDKKAINSEKTTSIFHLMLKHFDFYGLAADELPKMLCY